MYAYNIACGIAHRILLLNMIVVIFDSLIMLY